VWVDGRPVSPPLHLRGSSGRWRPIATAEAWDGGRASCNRFSYGFEDVAVATGRGGGWKTFRSGHRFQDSGFRVLASRSGTFLARTTVLPPALVRQKRPKPVVATAPAPTPAPTLVSRPVEHPFEALAVEPQPPVEGAEPPPPAEPAPVDGAPAPDGVAEGRGGV
jgi:hypothetical protein